jgi:hypothetical protein
VPPGSIGGREMTRTCCNCNNKLGARVEDELAAWYDGAYGHVRFANESSGVLGRRKVWPLLLRQTTNGEPMLILGKVSPEVRQMMRPGSNVEADMTPPEPHRYRLAALKQAYLAACLLLGCIPDTPSAEQIRTDLLAARDAPSNAAVPTSAIARNLPLARAYTRHAAPPLALCRYSSASENGALGLLLAGAVLVGWPLADIELVPG